MNSKITLLQNQYKNDLIVKHINSIYVLFLESLCDSKKINEFILKKLSYESNNNIEYLPSPNAKKITYREINNYLENAFAIVINNDKIFAIEVRAEIFRSISTPDSEPSLNGPKDAFNESYQTNIGLIRRRIKTKELTIENFNIGTETKTIIGLIYLKNKVNYDILNILKQKINSINTKGIIDSSTLSLILQKENNSSFPTIIKTERPDTVCSALIEGKMVLVVDNSPYVLILPAHFIDFINPQSDNYQKNKNINFVKILRIFCFFISMIFPSFYIAIINYNQETIPTSLLINFAIQRDGVPFPGIIEAILMLCICEILRESDLRFPNAYGSAISILGALVLGEAAVSAGIVSPIMIIVIAITFITSLIFTEYEIINVLRKYRFIYLFFTATYGILGISFATILFLININNITFLNNSYFFPISPFNKRYFNNSVIKKKENKL